MTEKWLFKTPNLPRIPIFYAHAKIYKLTPVGRPIISGVSGPKEPSFVDKPLQPIAQQQKSFLKDTLILGDPGAASLDDGIFMGESLQQARSCCKLSPMKIPSSRLAAPGSPRMRYTQPSSLISLRGLKFQRTQS